MHVILADSIDGGILMILLMGGGLAVSVLALIALIPAWQRNLAATLILAGPAFLGAIAATVYCVWWSFFGAGPGDRGDRGTFLALWAILAGPPLATSLLAVFFLWFRRAGAKQSIGG